jgi:hypothetical protein
MPRERVEKTIGDCTYFVRPLDAVEGSRMLARIHKLLLPALGSVEGLEDVKIGKVLADLGASVAISDLDYLRDTFARTTEVRIPPDNREPLLSDELKNGHFAGEYDLMLEWLTFCLEVNFGSFFRGLKGRIGSALARGKKVPSSSTSPTPSTGASDGS